MSQFLMLLIHLHKVNTIMAYEHNRGSQQMGSSSISIFFVTDTTGTRQSQLNYENCWAPSWCLSFLMESMTKHFLRQMGTHP